MVTAEGFVSKDRHARMNALARVCVSTARSLFFQGTPVLLRVDDAEAGNLKALCDKWDGLNRTPGPMEHFSANDTAHTAASCGSSTECKDYSSIDGDVLAMIKNGFLSCAQVAGYECVADLASRVNYDAIKGVCDGCGFPAGTVKAPASAPSRSKDWCKPEYKGCGQPALMHGAH